MVLQAGIIEGNSVHNLGISSVFLEVFSSIFAMELDQ
jgi:hypothetical protein